MKILFIGLVGIIVCSSLIAQENEMQNLDFKLTQEFDKMMNADYENRYDSLAPRFKNHLKESLSNAQNFNLPLDSLSARIKIVKSEDANLIFYSWDEKTGGTWHDMTVFAQFKLNNGDVKIIQMDGNEGMAGEFIDVIIYEIHEIKVEAKPHYLTIGWGTYGSGHHHAVAQIFRIEENNLKNCKNCFERNENLVIMAPRSSEINLMFHPKNKKLTHNEFLLNEDTGFYKPTGNIATWELKEGKFKK